MKLFWGPHTCAIGIHILLEEMGRPYETEKIDVSGGATHQPQFLAINPKGKVPTLVRDDGSVLTEFGAIATWLARTHPETNLLPSDSDIEARVAETTAYVEGTIHGQGYARLFKPAAFAPDDLLHAKLWLGRSSVKRQGREIVANGFAILDAQLSRHPYAVGHAFTIADFALFYVERWAAPQGVELPVNVAAHFERMLTRPSVQKVQDLWGER